LREQRSKVVAIDLNERLSHDLELGEASLLLELHLEVDL
jgi:hypothetical protein